MVRPICAKHGLVITIEEDDVSIQKYGEKPYLTIKYKFILSHKDGETWGFRPSRTMMVEVKGGQSFGSAMASKEYAEHIKQLGQARRDKNLSLVKYNSYKKWLDLIQTKEANLRAEMMIK